MEVEDKVVLKEVWENHTDQEDVKLGQIIED
jgi:hypothetical protein